MGFGGSEFTSHAEEFLFLICPPVVCLVAEIQLTWIHAWGDPKSPFSSVSDLPPLHPFEGLPPIRLREVFLSFKILEKGLADAGVGNGGRDCCVCSLSLVCVAGVGAGESDLMCRILFITRSFFPVKLYPSTSCTIIRP